MGTYADIASGDRDQDSPVDTDLAGQYAANAKYNYDHLLRGGTDTAPVRLAIARKEIILSTADSDADHVFTGTEAIGGVDGNPNFSEPPQVFVTAEDVGSGDDWHTDTNYNKTGDTLIFSTWVKEVTDSQFTWYVEFNCDAGQVIHGALHWMAVGLPSSGE